MFYKVFGDFRAIEGPGMSDFRTIEGPGMSVYQGSAMIYKVLDDLASQNTSMFSKMSGFPQGL